MPNICVTVKDVSKTFGTGAEAVYALKDVSMKLYFGELAMIVGPSGSGKTTLLSTIAGTLHADAGSVEMLGRTLTSLPEEAVTAFRIKNIGFIFQQFHLIPSLTAIENVAIPLFLQGIEKKSALKKAEYFLNAVDIANKANRLPKELSGGQQQRVAIARALIHEPSLLICDEPTSTLDHETGIKIMDLLQTAAADHHRSVIVVTHDHRIFEYADRTIEMDDGVVHTVNNNRELSQ